MFPLLDREKENPFDLFQIWLNLPAKKKMVEPRFTMLWSSSIPEKEILDEQGRKIVITVRAGEVLGAKAPEPPVDSWAHDANNEVGIWTATLEPEAVFFLPAASPTIHRNIYVVAGKSLTVGGTLLRVHQGAELRPDQTLQIKNGEEPAEILILQGRPIGEPIARRGPFVMNTEAEIQKAYADFRETRFGGWPWSSSSPIHGNNPDRFARRADGKIERPG